MMTYTCAKIRRTEQLISELVPLLATFSSSYPLSSSTWSKRGWTFQESLLSQRKIIFCGDRVQWQCPCAVWNEDIELDDSITPVYSRGLRQDGFEIMLHGLLNFPWPDLRAYGELVRKYSAKGLTYPEDVLSAFSGFTNALASTVKGGFLFGIPEIFFDVGLLWKGNGALERRTASHIQGDTEFPSWSWMGWKGTIDGLSWNAGLHYIKKSDFMSEIYTSRRTTPLVQWYSGDKSNPRRKALTTFSTCTSFPDIGTANLEPGWTCHPNTTKRGSKMWSHWEFGDDGMSSHHVLGFHNLREPDYYYTHESDPKAEFWTPVPICGEAATNTLGTSVPFISCTTQRALFCLGGKLGYSTISIRTNSDAWAGCLELHHEAQVTLPGSPEEISAKSGDTCELVVISKGFAYNDNYEYSMDEWKCKEVRGQARSMNFIMSCGFHGSMELHIEMELGACRRKSGKRKSWRQLI